jgi:hypothetical protein
VISAKAVRHADASDLEVAQIKRAFSPELSQVTQVTKREVSFEFADEKSIRI